MGYELLLSTNKVLKETKRAADGLIDGNTSGVEKLLHDAMDWGMTAGKNVLLALVIFIIGHYLIRLVCKLMAGMMMRRKVDKSIQSFLNSFVNISLTILLIITVIGALGINTTSFAALLASAGVAVGMALSGNLQNFAGGLIILLLKPYKIGDYIEAQGNEGYVKEIQIFHTVLVTLAGKEVFLPNGAMSSGTIVNWNSQGTIRVQWIIGVEYGEDTEKARRVMLEIFKNSPMVLESPAPSVNLDQLAESSVNFVVRVWVDVKDYWPAYYGLQEDIYKAFNREGIGFPFPQLTIHKGK